MHEEHLCDHLYVRHSLDSVKKIRQEDGPEKVYKKWKRRWVVLSGNISPSKCFLNYCKKESDWLSKNQSEISKCQLTSFSVQKVTSREELANHLVISLRTYTIYLSFESVTKMDQWYKALERLLEFYDVVLHCPEQRGLKGEHVVQFSSPGPFKVWGMDGLLQWEWSLSTVRRIGYQKSDGQLEVEVGRQSCIGDGHFFFAGQRAFVLYHAIEKAMKLPVQPDLPPVQPEMSPVQLMQTPVLFSRSPFQAPRSPVQAPRSPLQAPRSPLQAPRSPVQAPRSPLQAPRSPVHPEMTSVHFPRSPAQPMNIRPTVNSEHVYATVKWSEDTFVYHSDAQTYLNDGRFNTIPNLDSAQTNVDDDDTMSPEYTLMADEDSTQTMAGAQTNVYDDTMLPEYTLMVCEDSAQTQIYDTVSEDVMHL